MCIEVRIYTTPLRIIEDSRGTLYASRARSGQGTRSAPHTNDASGTAALSGEAVMDVREGLLDTLTLSSGVYVVVLMSGGEASYTMLNVVH